MLITIEFQTYHDEKTPSSKPQHPTRQTMSTERLTRLLDDIRLVDPNKYELVQSLRRMILALAPGVTEEVKYGGILFSVEQPFCGVFSYAKHVSLEFGEGASLPDKHNVLEGAGRLRRHIKLGAYQDIADKQVADYLNLALQRATTP